MGLHMVCNPIFFYSLCSVKNNFIGDVMNRICTAVIFILFLSFGVHSSINAQQPMKRVLLEQYTGAWCGWCVDGSVVMDELIKEFPDNVIGVKVHQGDDMEIEKVFDSLKSMVPFYPSGSIDRMVFPGEATVGTGRDKWREYVLKQMSKGSDIDVKVVNVSYDKSTRIMKADVEATFVKSMSGDLRLNLMVIEDDVTGTGQGYDQSNYISGNASFKGHPYFDKPSVIKGYHHRSVVRAYPAGVWGIKNSIPAITSTGEKYTASFTYTVPEEFDAGNILLVGAVQKHGANANAREILNAHQVGLVKSPAIMETTVADQFQSANPDGSSNSSISIKNNNATPVQVSYEIDEVASIIPQGWKASVSKAQDNLEPGASSNISVTLNSNDVPGFAKIVVNAVVSGENVFTKSVKAKVYALSPSIKHVVYGSHPKMNALYMQDLEVKRPKSTAMIPMDADVLAGYPPQTFDMAIIAVDNENAGMIANNAEFLNSIGTMLQNGKKVFIASEQELSSIMKSNNESIKTLLDQTIGISVKSGSPVKRFEQDKNSGDILMAYPIQIKGQAGDYIGRDINVTLNEYFEDPVLTPFTRFTDVFAIKQGSSAMPVFTYDAEPTDIGAIRWENGDARLVIFGFGLDGLSNQNKKSHIMSRTYDWLLLGASSVNEQSEASHRIVPNPASDMAFVEFNAEYPKAITISVMDALGRTMTSFIKSDISTGKQSAVISIGQFPIGQYQIKIDGASQQSIMMPLVIIR